MGTTSQAIDDHESVADEIGREIAATYQSIETCPMLSAQHPYLVLLDRQRGLIALGVSANCADGGRQAFVDLNRRIAAFRADTQVHDDFPISRVLAVQDGLAEPVRSIAGRVLVPLSQFSNPDWLELIDKQPIDHEALDGLRAAMFPNIVFTASLRRGISEDGADDRAALRVVLDQQQASLAERAIEDTVYLTGPPGSGKTLVLAARARYLAARHPDWRIQLLCYNKTLVPYLRRLVAEAPNVRVNRVWEIASEFKIRFSYSEDKVVSAGLRAARNAGLRPAFDAVLIDEVQDFRVPWLDIAHALLRPGRGGMLLAGDPVQALYGDGVETFLRKVSAEHVQLRRPYRSTKQILTAVQSLDPSFAIDGVTEAPDGPPVDLVWAESWNAQADCVAFEVNYMLTEVGLKPHDIGILVTQYRGAYGRLKAALDAYDIPYAAMESKEKEEFDLFSNTVKLMTVHSAKGYEFRAVILFGLEAIPDPEVRDSESVRRGRVAFVGATRAADNLLITYTRYNKFLTQLSSDEQDVARYSWPDDYEGVPSG